MMMKRYRHAVVGITPDDGLFEGFAEFTLVRKVCLVGSRDRRFIHPTLAQLGKCTLEWFQFPDSLNVFGNLSA
jgi:hypothetical protein